VAHCLRLFPELERGARGHPFVNDRKARHEYVEVSPLRPRIWNKLTEQRVDEFALSVCDPVEEINILRKCSAIDSMVVGRRN